VKSRTAAIAFLLMLLLASCGARLTRAQRLAGIGGRGGSGAASTTGVTTGTAGTGIGTGTSTGTGGGTGDTGAATGTGGTGAAAAACAPGTNTASDTGVTPTEVRIATASDASGVQAGLFKSTHYAVQAFAAMVNSQGGLCGRAIKALPLDTRAESGANNAAVSQACQEDFALVGSMSAFDNGGASTGESCGIPDLTAITVNGARAEAKNVYPIYPIRPDKLAIGTANYIKAKYGNDVIKHAAMFYLNAGVTKSNALQRVKAYEGVGFHFTYIQEVQILEANYSGFVQKMKENHIRYVNMVANYQGIQNLLDAMDQQDWYPTVRDWDSVAYSPNFVVRDGKPFAPADGSLVFLNTALIEEAAGNPEMQLYIKWLGRVAPTAKPDYFGLYAWSAGRLFQKVATEVGRNLTRKAFLAAVQKIHSWDGNGMHAAHDIGNKIMSPCFTYLEIKASRFIRKDPSSGFICNKGGIVNT
jgi:ABC-type branched-subunit amino acid transport system substrate-binding protein